VPVVASPVGAAPEIVGEGERGVLAGDEAAWLDALWDLVGSAGRRTELGTAGRRWVAAEATVEATVGRWLDVLRSAAG
jgi:glycosyltransferase involved in cell wall biosynthesis